MKAGSYVIRPKSSSSTLMSRSASARIVPSSIGTSYVRPVRLSVIVRVSAAVATPSPLEVVCSSVPIPTLWGTRALGAQPVMTAVAIVAATSSAASAITAPATPRLGGNVSWRRIPIAETITANAASTLPAT